MGTISCDHCGKIFFRKPSQIVIAEKHYCSQACRYLGKRKGKLVICENCKAEIYKSLKDLTRSKDKNFFCSIGCRNMWYGETSRREKHPNWKGGEYSYKEALSRHTIERKCFLCKNNDQRILTVHHADQNRKNNDFENLMWLCYNCHFLVHHYIREKNKINKR